MKEEFEKYPEIDIYRKLLYIFLDEVLRDFQDYAIDEFKLPTALWSYDKNKELKPIKPHKRSSYFPDFCRYLQDNLIAEDGSSLCFHQDCRLIENYLKECETDSCKYSLLKCYMNISRMVFPLKIHGQIIGVFVAGKFMTDTQEIPEIISIMQETLENDSIRTTLKKESIVLMEKNKNNLFNMINRIPIFDNNKIERVSKKILLVLPLLNRLYARLHTQKQPTDSIFDGLLFLESLDHPTSELFKTYNNLWNQVDEIFISIIKKLRLETAVAFYTDTDDYQRLKKVSYSPNAETLSNELSMSSLTDIQWIEEKNRGILLPVEKGPLLWMNKHVKDIFGTKNAIIYAQHIIAQRLLLVGFGFKDNVYLNDFEKILLRISVIRIMKLARNYISNIELDELITGISHKLGRIYGAISGSVDYFDEYGYSEEQTKIESRKEIIRHTRKSFIGGLKQLHLITKNYHVFAKIIGIFPNDIINKEDYSDINLVPFLKQFNDIYSVDLEKDQKEIRFIFNRVPCILYSSEDPLSILFWNLFDNAIKFSYNNSYITVFTAQEDDLTKIEISNFGIGIATDEGEKMFHRLAKSRYRDPVKDTSGHGMGLSYCKRLMEYLFPEGTISITSKQADEQKHGKPRFEGDKHITTITLLMPHNVHKVMR